MVPTGGSASLRTSVADAERSAGRPVVRVEIIRRNGRVRVRATETPLAVASELKTVRVRLGAERCRHGLRRPLAEHRELVRECERLTR